MLLFSRENREFDTNQLKAALDDAAIISVTSATGLLLYTNKKFCEISKYSSEELIGQPHSIIRSGIHSQEFFDEMWAVISSGQKWEGEICNKTRDGEFFWVNTTIIPILDDRRRPLKYIAIHNDITRQKENEAKIKEYASRLEEKNLELQEFASIAAHDLQEPLRKIQVFSGMVVEDVRSSFSPEAKGLLGRVTSSAVRMQTLIDDLLSYTRIRSNQDGFRECDLNKVVAEALSNLEIRIQQSNAEIESVNLPTIWGDFGQLVQLFQNLIKNSIVYKKLDGTPKIEIKSKIMELAGLSGVRRFCEVAVIDNGIGFDEKYLDRIFNIFQRLHGRNEYEGTGIGLSICKKIVKRHNGHISAQSKLGEGAKFVVTLPLARQQGPSYDS